MANASSMRNSLGGFFKLADFAGGKSLNLTISLTKEEEVGEDKEQKPVLGFAETRKKLVLNATRVQQLEDLFGEADLIGKRIKLEKGEAENRGRVYTTLCIREAS